MKKMSLCMLLMLTLFAGCQNNPFGQDKISGDARTISGSVVNGDKRPLSGVYVWLDVVNVGTFSDASGNYILTLPPRNVVNSLGTVNGVFDLYFYTINHQLAIKKVFLKDGGVIYGEADVDKNGAIRQVYLPRTFKARTETAFSVIDSATKEKLSVSAHLTTEAESVSVLIPHGSIVLLGGVLIRSQATGKVYLCEDYGPVEPYVEQLTIRERIWGFHPNFKAMALTDGAYEVRPFIFPYYPQLPPQLLASLGMAGYKMNEKYWDICFDCERAIFWVLNE
jgi:hypothetical protein